MEIIFTLPPYKNKVSHSLVYIINMDFPLTLFITSVRIMQQQTDDYTRHDQMAKVEPIL